MSSLSSPDCNQLVSVQRALDALSLRAMWRASRVGEKAHSGDDA